ncbi:MAG: 23S rRNA (uracil(1939)-C(5))-methyltransferase RlmD [Ignavibacteriaceae bacterium]|nr:23S rRNA (uracil(1939)-C(5))-methyltransferase RlmD [Ignavibacteriaceae bacterium]
MTIKKGDVFEFTIEKYAFEGKGIAKVNRDIFFPGEENNDEKKYVVFVNGSYPGDVVKAKLNKIKKTYAEAKAIEIISPSNERVKAECQYFGTCGGCKQQDLGYQSQTKYKQQQVEEIFTRLGGLSIFEIEPILPSEIVFHYRNKMEYSFGGKRWLTLDEISSGKDIDRNFALGLHIPGMFDKILDINICYLQSPVSSKILNLTRDFFKSRGTTIYSTNTHEGYLRNLVIKLSHNSDDLMVNLVTSYENDDMMNEYTTTLLKEVPEIKTVINNINLKKAAVAVGDHEKIFFGSGFIYDSIGKYKFRISANSFFQTNTHQAERLYSTVLNYAGLTGEEIVYDLYSGAGTISIYISSGAKKVYAFETVESAVADANENIKLNNIENVGFVTADLYKSFLPQLIENNIPKPDVIVIDPPRSGMHENTVNDVITLQPHKIVYVSCNPTTQVRDIKIFSAAGYKLIKIKPVDMFPQTFHIENVALLVKEEEIVS